MMQIIIRLTTKLTAANAISTKVMPSIMLPVISEIEAARSV